MEPREKLNKLLAIAQEAGAEVYDCNVSDNTPVMVKAKMPDGACFRLMTGQYRYHSKINAMGLEPEGLHHYDSSPEINFALDKEVRLCVRDIERRLLPDVRKHWNAGVELKAKQDAAEAGRQSAINQLVEAGAIHRGGGQYSDRLDLILEGSGYIRDLNVNHDGSGGYISINAIPLGKLVEIIKVLKS